MLFGIMCSIAQYERELITERMMNGKITKVRITPQESPAKNPAFDVTPARYITGIITEKGIIKSDKEEIKKLFYNVSN